MWKWCPWNARPTPKSACSSTRQSTNTLYCAIYETTRSKARIFLLTFWKRWSHGSNAAVWRSNVYKRTMVLNLPTVFPTANAICLHASSERQADLTSRTNWSVAIWNGTQPPVGPERFYNTHRPFSLTKIDPTSYLCAFSIASFPKTNLLLFLTLSLFNMFGNPTIYNYCTNRGYRYIKRKPASIAGFFLCKLSCALIFTIHLIKFVVLLLRTLCHSINHIVNNIFIVLW